LQRGAENIKRDTSRGMRHPPPCKASECLSQPLSRNERCHPRNLAHADSKAVTPINPAAQKFRVFILCSALDNSAVALSNSIERPRLKAAWVPGHWDRRGREHVWAEGHWR
jgi:hypothetical protein